MKKLWGGRFAGETDPRVDRFGSSITFDERLYRQDIEGSMAHARMLGRCGIISEEEAERIVEGLKAILEDIREGRLAFDLSAEDIHMNVEKLLIERIGDVGKKLHTARSRNDQVALDTRRYLKEEIRHIQGLINHLQESLLEVAEGNIDVIMPGYTHLQRAQPVLFAHHLMAYFFMLERDYERLSDCFKRTDVMPLGSGALAGTTFPIDREYVAEELGFSRISQNSMDAVSDRDFVIEFIAAASILMMHLSRFCEELILWSSREFDFIEMDDAFATGSSIMPQKKNPDVAELIRGKTGRVYGNLMAILTVMKGLPLAYNKDMQEDKEPLFDTVDTVKACLEILAPMIKSMRVKKEEMRSATREGFLAATDLADYLARQGIPFREAHEVVGRIVRYCVEKGKDLDDLTVDELRAFSPFFGEDALAACSIEGAVKGRNLPGGTSPESVRRQIAEGREWLKGRSTGR